MTTFNTQIKEVIINSYNESVEKAWLNLSRNKFSQFGYWSAKESQINTLALDINKKLGYEVIKLRPTNKSPFFELKKMALKEAK